MEEGEKYVWILSFWIRTGIDKLMPALTDEGLFCIVFK